MEHVVSALGQIVDVALVDQLVVGWVDAALVDAKHIFIRSVWFVRCLNEVLGSEGFAIRILGMRWESGVQVRAEHVHDDRRVRGQVGVPLTAFEISSSVPSEGTHASSLRKLFDPFDQIFLVWCKIQILHYSIQGWNEWSFHERCLLQAADAGFSNLQFWTPHSSQLSAHRLNLLDKWHQNSFINPISELCSPGVHVIK